jgi:hypothetical protein
MRRPSTTLPSARPWPRLLPVILAGLGLAQVLALRSLGYSQTWLTSVKVADATSPRDPMELGGLRWDPAPYIAAPALAPLRALVQQRCPHLGPTQTATCLADVFAQRFAHGAPPFEFFGADYSPAAALTAHLAGTPGHCVTRSGLIAAALLASGVPARVVQLLPANRHGHNVVEIWEPARGWTLLDPTYRMQVESAGGPSAAAAVAAPQTAQWRVNDAIRPVQQLEDLSTDQAVARSRALIDDYVLYPDPWLYTRVGHKSVPQPFRGRFVMVGARSLTVGFGQPLLQGGILLCLIGLVISLFSGRHAPVHVGDVVLLPLAASSPAIPSAAVIARERGEAMAAGSGRALN